MKKHDFTPFLALFGIFLLFVGFVLLLFLGQQEDRYAIVSFVILCLGCTLFGIGIGKWISHRLHSVLKESKSPKKAPPPTPSPPQDKATKHSDPHHRQQTHQRNPTPRLFVPKKLSLSAPTQRLSG